MSSKEDKLLGEPDLSKEDERDEEEEGHQNPDEKLRDCALAHEGDEPREDELADHVERLPV